MSETKGTTNQQEPFQPGEIIAFAGETYEVVQNSGRGGTVKEHPNGDCLIYFYWRYEGEDCRRVVANG